MKKILCAILVSTMLISMVSCGKSEGKETEVKEDSAATEADTEAERTTLTVGFDAEFPPYGFMDESGEYTGFDLELAQAVCDMEGWELVKQPIDWEAKDAELASGAIDCIWNGFTINGREDAYTWSTPYVDNSQVFVVGKDSGITKPEELAGRVVVVQKDSSALAALNEEENAALKESFGTLMEQADYNTAFMELDAGSVDCVALDIGVAKYQLSSRGDTYVILDDYLSTEQYGIGFLLGNESLRDKVQEDLNALYKDGTVDKIEEMYSDFGLTDSLCLEEYVK